MNFTVDFDDGLEAKSIGNHGLFDRTPFWDFCDISRGQKTDTWRERWRESNGEVVSEFSEPSMASSAAIWAGHDPDSADICAR